MEGLHNCAIRNGTSRTGGTSGWQKTSHGRESTILEHSARERVAEVLANQSPPASVRLFLALLQVSHFCCRFTALTKTALMLRHATVLYGTLRMQKQQLLHGAANLLVVQ